MTERIDPLTESVEEHEKEVETDAEQQQPTRENGGDGGNAECDLGVPPCAGSQTADPMDLVAPANGGDAAYGSREAHDPSDVIAEIGGSEEARISDARRRAHDELLEFYDVFPNVRFSEIPVSVRESELPLAAAYALYEKRAARLTEKAEAANQSNTRRSAGAVSDGEEGFFTPEEVRRMTRAEVRNNYDGILRSMKRWK